MTTHAASRTNGNRLKGVLAAGAAAALGLGLFSANGGSFALWQDSADLGNDTTIQSGRLDLTTGAGVWQVDPVGAAGPESIAASGVAAYQVVPGDTFVYSQEVTLDAAGDNLAAELGFTLPSITGDKELADALSVTFTATNDDETVTGTAGYDAAVDLLTGELRLADEDPWFNEPLTVIIEVTLPEGVAGTTAQDMQVTLAPATVTATQVLPSA